jgi:hypothetical protein
MTATQTRLLALLAVTGACASANAQFTVNLSGATLLQNFIRDPLSTVDVIDVNLDGRSRTGLPPVTQQLVFAVGDNPAGLPGSPSFPNASHWVVQYRSVGSVNGIRDLARFGRPTVVTEPREGPLMDWRRTESISWQHRVFIDNANTSPIRIASIFDASPLNPSALPNRSITTAGTEFAFVAAGSTTGGVQVDIAPVDVPTSWGVLTAGTASAIDKPLSPGYGTNNRVAVNTAGVLQDGSNERNRWDLVNLAAEGRNLNLASPNTNTIYDTTFTFAPVAGMANRGVNQSNFTMAELRHLMGAGRLPNGENLTAVTRSVGSGTHNAFMNSIGLDPSYGVGEAIGPESSAPLEHVLGDLYNPGNAQGSGLLETKLRNTRLGIGYSGSERAVVSNTVTQRRFDLIAIRADGGTDFVRSGITRIINNGLRGQTDPDGGTYSVDGWRIGGPAILATLGDPRSAPVNKGGDASNTNPDMDNIAAASYVNNITRAIAITAASPTCPLPPAAQRGPAEALLTRFVLVDATDRVQRLAPTVDPQDFIINPAPTAVRQGLANLYLTCTDALGVYRDEGPGGVYDSARGLYNEYQSPSRQRSTDSPPRTTNYSDNRIDSYRTLNNINIGYNVRMDQAPVPVDAYERNRTAGDFNGDGQRNINDTREMMQAFRFGHDDTRATGTWDGGDVEGGTITAARGAHAIPEMLGDHNGDGNFDARDIRYAADGLALVGGNLDRKAGFTAVDNEWFTITGNFFYSDASGGGVVTLATGTAYKAGDARADIAGGTGVTRGFAPIGNDGAVDAKDIDYVSLQFRAGDVNWASNLSAAVLTDLSADITGDLVINRDDVTDLLNNVLCTRWWDVNLDGTVDQADRDIVTANLNTAGGWARGDVNNDGQVTNDDLVLICAADFNGDGSADFFDYLDFVAAFDSEVCYADFNGDSAVDFFDYLDFVAAFDAGC